ncbi:gp436 family protein [Acinetobacter sp. P8-3-8]|uniref:gp436 family protein n=1 Tax=Acinetobacter sp. P8-3-8 TaxID=1029823 RepID=UPI0002486ED5|nr:DUF1320 domain-containing protein [Acinetobacter sp. P8-3-8]
MYATEADLKRRFGAQQIENLKLMVPDDGSETVDVVQTALQDATEEINGYIGGRYPLPLPNVPSNLNRIACDIARYRLYFEQPSEHVTKLYDDAIAFLKRVQDKKADLQIQDAETQEIVEDQPKNKPSTVPIGTTYTGGVFGDSTLDMMPSMK